MISDLPLEILHRIICFLPNPKKFLRADKRLHKTGKDLRFRGLWVLHQGKTFRSWLSIAARNRILGKELIITMIRILDDFPCQRNHQAKLIDWIVSYSRPARFPSATEKLKHAIVSKNEQMLKEFLTFFSTKNGTRMKDASVELCRRVGFRKGVSMLKCL